MVSRFSGKNLRYALPSALALILAIFFLIQSLRPPRYHLRISGGDSLGRRHQLAKLLQQEAVARNIHLEVKETSGSLEALRQVSVGSLDLALIQGGQEILPKVRQVAALTVEPLHFLVKKELAGKGFSRLRGKRLNLSTRESGTRRLSEELLHFLEMQQGVDFIDESRPYAQLEALSYGSLPDGVFLVSTMPSPVADFLIRKHGYQLEPLPYGEALALRDIAVVPTTIPAYAYGVSPPEPKSNISTVGNRLLLVASTKVAPAAVRELLETLREASFLHRANLPDTPEETLVRSPEMLVHPGTTDYLERNKPAFTSDDMQGLDSLRNLVASILVGGYFLWRWLQRRNLHGMEVYLHEVTAIERVAMAEEQKATPDMRELLRIRNRLSVVKTEALEKFSRGQLRGEEWMNGFLTHVSDVRAYVTALMLNERERIANLSATPFPDEEQEARFIADWTATLQRASGDKIELETTLDSSIIEGERDKA